MTGNGERDQIQINHLCEQARSRWLNPAEVFFILERHHIMRMSTGAPHMPLSGSLFLFDKKNLSSFRADGYTWKKESHVLLTVKNAKVLNCYYAYRADRDNPKFCRRSYWMLNGEKKHIVLVHYIDTTTKLQGKTNPASASGQCYNLSQIDKGFPLGNQGTPSLGMHGSNQSLCSLVTEQQHASVGTSRHVDANPSWQTLEPFGPNDDTSWKSIPFDNQKMDTNGTANSLVLGEYVSNDFMVSDSSFPAAILDEIGFLLSPQEAQNFVGMGTYITEPGESQMDPEVHPSLAIVSKHKFTIREISPQWGYADEATKVFIIGSFHCDPSKIACAMFGDTEVPVEIIQDGVICCEAPPCQLPGKVTFCITSGNREPCSEAIRFEYRDRNSTFHNRIRHQQEEDRSMEEANLIVKFAQMLLPKSSLQKESESTEAHQTGCGSSSDTIDQVLQELLKDKLLQWLYERLMKGGGPLSKKEQEIIHVAAALGYEWALNPLLFSGVGVNFRDKNGWAALHWAAKFGREKMVRALIKAGASAGATTYSTRQEPKGITPASIADANGHKGLAGYLTVLAVTAHLSSLTLEEASSVDLEAVDVSNISIPEVIASGEDQRSLEQVIDAIRKTTQAAAKIIDALRLRSFRKRQQREAASCSNVNEYGLTSDDIQWLSSALKAVFSYSHDHNAKALPIKKRSTCGKARKRSFKLRRKAVKIQPRIRKHRVRERYKNKVLWAAGILEKVALRWLRKGAGLRGYKPNREVTDDEDILKDFRREIVDRIINEVSRVQSMVHCPEAQRQYTRLREPSQQDRDESDNLTIEEVMASLADVDFPDNDTDEALMPLLLEPPADSPGYSELWADPVY